MKNSKTSNLKNNFYFTIFYYIREGLNPTQISKKLNISKQRLNYYTKRLQANGLIQKLGKGVWKVSKTFDFNTIYKNSKKNIRSHAFIFSLKLPKKIENWKNRETYLKKNAIEYKQFKNRNMQQITFRNYKIQIGNKSIVVYQPKYKSYFVESAKTGFNYAIYDFEQIIIGLENLFNISFRIRGNLCFKVSRQHHALIKNELARMYNRNNKKLKVYDDNGVLRLITDNSLFEGTGQEELEAVSNEHSIPDVDKKVNPFLKQLLTHNWNIESQLQLNQGILQTNDMFKENMKSHIKAIQSLSKGVDELTKTIKKMKGE